jgi:hypothetical protein
MDKAEVIGVSGMDIALQAPGAARVDATAVVDTESAADVKVKGSTIGLNYHGGAR